MLQGRLLTKKDQTEALPKNKRPQINYSHICDPKTRIDEQG